MIPAYDSLSLAYLKSDNLLVMKQRPEAYTFVESVRRTKSTCIVICDIEIVKTYSNVFLTHKIQVYYLIEIV